MRIGITDTFNEDKYENYIRWLLSIDDKLEIVKLSYRLNNASEIARIDGLLLAGGGDINPRFYGKEQEINKVMGYDEKRDEFEFKLIADALDSAMPILGVCRGMQTLNVYLGGSLIIDLMSSGFDNHISPTERIINHTLSIVPYSLLHALTGTVNSEVNSFHHQAVERLGRGLVASAVALDGVIEAAEWAIKDGMSFLMLVQWHPERMKEELLSQKLARIFLREVYQFHYRT